MEIFNTKQYPIHDLDHMSEELASLKQEYQNEGVVVLKNFLTTQCLNELIDECKVLGEQAYFNTVTGNPYLCGGDETLPDDHALNYKESTTVGVIAGDQLNSNSLCRKIYHSKMLRDFVSNVLEVPKLFDYQCKLGFINIAKMVEDNYLRWHFDLSDFVVSIPIQNAAEGGIYQYIKNFKSDDDPNYEGVSDFLKNGSSDVKSLKTPAGSLILFQGRHTLHRVTKVEGNRDRYVLLLGFATKDNVSGSDYLRQIRYGRTS